MTEYVVEKLDIVTLGDGSPIDGMELMSPFVWEEGGNYRLMVRAVPHPLGPQDPTGVIASGSGEDGLTFRIDDDLAIVPSADPAQPDAGGCEDPTVERAADGSYLVFYTGVDARREQGCMMLAQGPTLTSLTKQQLVIKAPPGAGNIKEATLARTRSGAWRLFYEYAADNASRIGVAAADHIGGPWKSLPDPFGIREAAWDNWHLSTGPIVCLPGRDPVMFYNGATIDARWRIGWVSFDPDFGSVTDRGVEPMLIPPPDPDRMANDIAFAASAIVEGERIRLYYSLADRLLRRADVAVYG